MLGSKVILLQKLGFCNYVGEIDKNGKACGYGTASSKEDARNKSFGTFYDDKEHGICN